MKILELLNANEIAVQIASFLLLLILLRAFVWKGLLGFLDKRKEGVASLLKNAENASLKAEGLKAAYDAKMASSDEEARRRVQEALSEIKELQVELKKEAHKEAQAIIDAAREDIKYEFKKAKEELKEKIIDISIKAAESAIQEKLTEENDRKLVKDFLDKIEI